jgi:hypothetical protein
MHNQTTIAGSDRFTRTVSCLPFLLRVLFAKDHRGVDLISDTLPFGRLYTKNRTARVAKHFLTPTNLALNLFDGSRGVR